MSPLDEAADLAIQPTLHPGQVVSPSEILASISEGVIVLSIDWTVLYVNAVAARVVNLSEAELLGRDYWELFPSSRGTALEAAYRQAAADGKRTELDHWSVRLHRWYRVYIHPWRRGLTICFTDITAQKQAAAAQEANEDRFRLATSNRFLTLYEQDRDLRYTWLYPQHAEHRLVLGRTDEELQANGAAQNLTKLKQYVMTSGLEIRREIEAHLPSGIRYFDLFVAPRRDASGEIIGVAGTALDITDRKNVEQALRRNEARLRTTYDHAPVGIAEADLDGTLLATNAKYCAQLGYSREELLGRSFLEIIHPDDVAATHDNYNRLVRGEIDFYANEKRYLHKAGHVVWVSVSVSLIRDEKGTAMFGLAITQDITDRKRADDARRRLVAIVETSDEAIVSKDLNGVVQTWNRGAEQMFGFTAAEMIGQSITRIIPPDLQHEEDEILEWMRVRRTTRRYDTIRLHKDGRRLNIALAVSPLRDVSGNVVGISKIAHDVTREKQAALHQHLLYRLVASVNRADALNDVYDAALDALCQSQGTPRASVLLFDESGVMRFTAWRGLSEDYRAAVEGHSPWAKDATDPQPICIDDISTFPLSPAVRQAIAREGIRAAAFIPLTYENRLLGKFMVYFDTPRRVQPEELRVAETIARQVGIAIERWRAAHALEALVASRTASLQEAIQQMEEFSYSVSHDLRAPIRAMIGYADILLNDFGGKLDDEVRRFLDRILKNAHRMEALVRDTLAFSKLARREITLSRVSLDRVLADVISALDLSVGNPEITCTPPLGDVLGHEPSLAQVVTNLLRNALKFVAPGVAPRVHVRSESRAGHIRLWVEDNGIGIPPEWHARLFGMFERLHVERNYEGTGIGLAIVRKAIERMGGSVGVASDGVMGSQFWIELPSAPDTS